MRGHPCFHRSGALIVQREYMQGPRCDRRLVAGRASVLRDGIDLGAILDG